MTTRTRYALLLVPVITPEGGLEASASPLTANSFFNSAATVGADGTVYAVHDALWAFKPTGEPKWVAPYPDFAFNEPAIGPDGTIYGSASSYTIATNPDGTNRWMVPTGGGSSGISVASDGTIYTGGEDGRLFAINPNGTIRWTYQTVANPKALSGGVYTAPTIAPDGTIYIANARSMLSSISPPAYLYALRPDGTLKWRYEIPGHSHPNALTGFFQPVVLDRDGNLYGCALNGSCYSWTPDGALRWEYVTQRGWSIHTVPLLVDDGLIWILSPHDNAVLALADPALPLLRAAPEELSVRTCQITMPFTLEVAVNPGGADIAWQAALRTSVPWATVTTTSGTGPGVVRLQIDPRRATAAPTFLRLSTSDERVANKAQLVALNIVAGCPIYLPALER